jgi:hypothetical protein
MQTLSVGGEDGETRTPTSNALPEMAGLLTDVVLAVPSGGPAAVPLWAAAPVRRRPGGLPPGIGLLLTRG